MSDTRRIGEMNVSLRPLEDGDLDAIRRVGVDRGFAAGRGEEIEETILRLD